MKYTNKQVEDQTASEKLLKRKVGLDDRYSTEWIVFDEYTIEEVQEGVLYIRPKKGADFKLYNPFNVAEPLVIDTLGLGDAYLLYQQALEDKDLNAYRKRKCKKMWYELQEQILKYVKKYGLMGFMSSSTYNRNIVGDKEILLTQKNPLSLKTSHMNGQAYMKLFTPFIEEGNIDLYMHKDKVHFTKYEDTPKYYGKRPLVLDLIFSSFYAENIVWLLDFSAMLARHYDQLATFKASALSLTEPVTILADQFEATKIGFTITQGRETKISWEFDSLKTTVQTIYAFAVTDRVSALKRCEHCRRFYIANSTKEKYCGASCRNRYNVMKSRERMKNENSSSK